MDMDKGMPRYDVECNYKDTRNAENVWFGVLEMKLWRNVAPWMIQKLTRSKLTIRSMLSAFLKTFESINYRIFKAFILKR